MSNQQFTTVVIPRTKSIGNMGWYLMAAASAGLLDWATKFMAVHYLADNTRVFGERFALYLVYNKGGAGGMSWGPYTWLINVCVTSMAVFMISMVVGPLAKVDRRATWALGLVAGGATGNLVSMLAGAEGVADFLAFRFGDNAVIANVADLALWSGALLLIPVVYNLVMAIRRERSAKSRRAIRYIEA
ncbi:MAG: signal peptidase II [Gemmatimonadaceae bacterium]